MTNGQAITCLEGLNDTHFVDSQSLLISACDKGVIFDQEKYQELLNFEDIDVLVWGCRGYIITNPSMYSWIYEKNKYISKISVKNLFILKKIIY